MGRGGGEEEEVDDQDDEDDEQDGDVWVDGDPGMDGDLGDGADDDDAPPNPCIIPEGWEMAPAPTKSSLDSDGALPLVGKRVLVKWACVGWSAGVIARQNKNKRKTLAGAVCNYFVLYDHDQLEAAHVLSLESYGNKEDPNSWFLIQELPTD